MLSFNTHNTVPYITQEYLCSYMPEHAEATEGNKSQSDRETLDECFQLSGLCIAINSENQGGQIYHLLIGK